MPRIMLTWTLWATVVGSSLAQTTFTSPACTPLVLEAPLIATDLDGDGDSDIASAAGPVLQFRYTSNGISSAINEMITLPGVILRADSGDIDGDGDTDIVVHYQTSTTATGVSVIESRPTGWLRRDLSSTFFAVPGIQLLDLDGDGDLDLFIGHRTMMWNPGDGQFSSALPLFFTPSAPNAIPLTAPIGHDVDGDGDIDFVYCESIPGLPAASRLILQIYEGGSIYRRHQLFPRCDGQVPTLIWGDFDGDGDPDLAAAQEGPFGSSTGSNVGWSTRIAVFLQTSPLRFLSLTSFLTAPQTLSPAGLQQFWGEFSVGCSDVDADGFDDLLIRHRFAAGNPNQVEPAVSIMRGRPSGLLENTGLAPTPVSRGTIQFVDFDLDGHVDLLTHGLTGPANPLTLCLHRGLGVTFPPRSFVIERVGLPLRHFWSGHVGHLGFR
ncbi:MAG: VCBS repeat-containing protein, partial [Planctomycetes bacterium]|nr:VCBS repeat-containing protein [Planctomycetota bacterium]